MSALHVRGLRSAQAGPFDLDAHAGDCVAITGPSGAGKSLFLRMLADLDPNEGEVSLDGTDRAAVPATVWRRRVIYSAAEPAWWAEDVAAHLPPGSAAEAAALAARLGLTEAHLAGPVSRLSTGERQRLALIRALLRHPGVLLADEPTAALDEASIGPVEALLRERMAGGLLLILVTHRPEQAARLGTIRRRIADRRFADP